MVFFVITSIFFIMVFTVLALILVQRAVKSNCELAKIKASVDFAINRIKSARYGDFKNPIDIKNDKTGLYKSLNNLFESISDRDFVINEYREKERENYNLKEEFIAALTHDLKVPIIAQDKTYDLLLEGKFGCLDEKINGVILRLKESNYGLKEMVNSILETYKIENKGVELKITKEIDVKKFINEIVEGLLPLLQAGGKQLIFHSCAEDVSADFDDFLIKRVISNLINNAICHSAATEKIDIYLNKTGDTFSIDVIDYGDGIDEDEIQKIFNKYYSITNKTTRISSGLGLYLSNKIVKKHKGVIEVESKKGEGSIFRVILPLKSKEG